MYYSELQTFWMHKLTRMIGQIGQIRGNSGMIKLCKHRLGLDTVISLNYYEKQTGIWTFISSLVYLETKKLHYIKNNTPLQDVRLVQYFKVDFLPNHTDFWL